MKKAVVWGVGSTGRHVCDMSREDFDVLCWGGGGKRLRGKES